MANDPADTTQILNNVREGLAAAVGGGQNARGG